MGVLTEFNNFVIGVRPGREALDEAMFSLTIDGRPASHGEVRELRKKEWEGAKFWGRSGRLYDQAAFFATNPVANDEETAEKLLVEAGEWARAEQQVIGEVVRARVGGGHNSEFEQTAPWREVDELERLSRLGEEVAVLDHPIVAVAFARGGWDLELGAGKRADMQGSWDYANWAVEAGIKMLNGVKLGVDWMSGGDGLDRRYRPDMRVHWSFKPGGDPEWQGREFMALGIIRTF